MIGLARVLVQTAAILRPLDRLRRDVAQRWEGDEVLVEAEYPEEVAPLVGDINTLLARNREIVARSRRQAADLAHALKTPSAILRNELVTLDEGGQDIGKALDALDRVDAQLARSLARLRTANTGETMQARTDLSHSVARFARLFATTALEDSVALGGPAVRITLPLPPTKGTKKGQGCGMCPRWTICGANMKSRTWARTLGVS